MAPNIRRPPPPYNPQIESWLESMPPTNANPSPAELRQWKLDDSGAWSRIWLYSSISIRAASLVLAFAVVIVALVMLSQNSGLDLGLTVPSLVVCALVVIWNTFEFFLFFFRGRGNLFSLHVWVDCLVFLGAAASTIVIFVDIVVNSGSFLYEGSALSLEFAQVSLLIVLAALHAVLFFLYVCNCIDRRGKQATKARIMYLNTGDPGTVEPQPDRSSPVLRSPLPAPESHQLDTLAARDDERSEPADDINATGHGALAPPHDKHKSAGDEHDERAAETGTRGSENTGPPQ